ncbi:hypothetical protein FEM48_Zijuj07G0047100 [Ziziphus jujuba var. spinosa]|uniref:3'-5' exonuclease domain-containing protein n=1 Tax=Ziziphus jujuba var. spinosa TaxID=714518 RepID=A0A978V2I4_ZIZJJ|nr:hypothetical protein FEM48_Zijuj07G0047100 [Ziziphus jujuba var. spinosa]
MEFHSIDFCGTKILTTVTSSAEEVNKWISRIYAIHRQRMSNLILGLDIEWHPFFKPGKRNLVAIIQISVGHRCLIFQLLHASSIPKSLSEFLANPEFTFVGVGVKEDADKLLQDWRLRVGNTVDLAHAAAEKYGVSDYKRKGLKKLAMELIGKCMQKPIHVTLSEWDAKKLSHEQVEYASIDAYVSFELGMSLKKGGYHYDDRYNIDDPIMECHNDPYHPNIDPYNYGHPILMDQLYHYDVLAGNGLADVAFNFSGIVCFAVRSILTGMWPNVITRLRRFASIDCLKAEDLLP